MSENRTAVIIERNRLFREGLKELLRNCLVTVVAEGSSFAEVLDTIDAGTPPDLAICNLEVVHGPEPCPPSVQNFKRQFPVAKLVVLANTATQAGLACAADMGSDAFLLTDMPKEALERCLELVLLGQQLFPAPLASRRGLSLIEPTPHTETQTPPHIDLPAVANLPILSPREQEIVECLVNGWPNKVIARRLGITEATVKVHVKGLLRKVRATNRTQVAIWALGQGITLNGQSQDGDLDSRNSDTSGIVMQAAVALVTGAVS